MKTLRTLLVIAIATLGFATTSFGQDKVKSTQELTATATVYEPLTIAAGTSILNFGTFAGLNSGTSNVVIPVSGDRTGTARLVGTDGNPGTFVINGQANGVVTITLPEDATLLTSDGKPSMSIAADSWTTSETNLGSVNLGAGGELEVTIGATLTVGEAQDAGDYIGTFNVSVNYN